jgi:hypothetical protein
VAVIVLLATDCMSVVLTAFTETVYTVPAVRPVMVHVVVPAATVPGQVLAAPPPAGAADTT